MVKIFISNDSKHFSIRNLSKKDKTKVRNNPNLLKNKNFLISRSLLQKYKIKRNFCLTHKENFSFAVYGKKFAIDAETLKDRDFNAISKICFNQNEKEILKNSKDIKVSFYQIWTLKEAVLKISKSNLTRILFVGFDQNLRLLDEKKRKYKFLSFICKIQNKKFLISLVGKI